MTLEELYLLDGHIRLEAINEMSMEDIEDICDYCYDCTYCPLALIYESYNGPRVYCTKPPFAFRSHMMIAKGAKFRTLEEYKIHVQRDER